MELKSKPKYKELQDQLRMSAKKSLTPKEQREGAISFTMGMLDADDTITREEVAKIFNERHGEVS